MAENSECTESKKPAAKKICSAWGCNNYQETNKDVSYFRFPKENDRCKTWIHNIRRADLVGKSPDLLRHRVICALHFEENQFKNRRLRNRLVAGAVPTLINAPNPPKPMIAKRPAPRERKLPSPKKRKVPQEMPVTPRTVGNSLREIRPETPVEMNLRKKNQSLRTKLSRLRRKLKTPNKQQKRKEKVDSAIKSVSEVLTGGARDFFITQIKMGVRSKYGYRWTEQDKGFALTLFHSSPKCYRLLAKTFTLPSVRTLRKCMQNININSGFHASVLEGLKNRVSSMSAQQKVCCVVFDEMSIKEQLIYNIGGDKIDGFETISSGVGTRYVANHAGVFIVRGIAEKWKQPVGYFLSSGPISAKKLKVLVSDCICKLQDIGLTVKLLICDQGSNNRSMVNSFGVQINKPYFEINGNKIYVMYDPPHLIKNVRNNLKKSGFSIDGQSVQWSYIEEFFNFDSNLAIRMAPKLTAKHIELPPFTAMRVKYATQVLSHTVAAGITTLCSLGKLDEAALPTAEFIKKFDQLFDVFNSGQLFSTHVFRRALKSDSGHLQFLDECSEWIAKIQKTGTKKSLPCLQGWLLSISCLKHFWVELHTNFNFNFLLTNRMNQDCIENFFSIIRGKGGHRDNPDAVQFRAAYRDACVDSMFVKSNFSNCEGDLDCFLLKLRGLQTVCDTNNSSQNVQREMPQQVIDLLTVANSGFEQLNIPEENVIVYIAGYLISKAKKKFSCTSCFSKWTDEQSVSTADNETNVFVFEKKLSPACKLVIPSSLFVEFIKNCESIFTTVFETCMYLEKVRTKLVKRVVDSGYTVGITCTEGQCTEIINYIVNLFIIVRITHALKMENRNFQANRTSRNRKIMKLKHL